MATLARTVETGIAAGLATIVLVATGILLSPTLGEAWGYRALQLRAGNGIYAAHVAAAALLVAFVLVHLVPVTRSFGRHPGRGAAGLAASYALLALVAVEVFTGYALWRHDYRIIGKATAVAVHLIATAVLVGPFVAHAWRGLGVALDRRRAKRTAFFAAVDAGRGAEHIARQDALTRRAFLRMAAYATAGLALAWALGRTVADEISAWRLNFVGETPRISKEAWRLKVTGLVEKPVTLTYADLTALGTRDLRFTHHCVEGWSYTDTFTGVPLSRVLAKAGGTSPGAAQLIFKSEEISTQRATRGQRYTTNFPVADGLPDDVLLVIGVGGKELPAIHGGPVRLMTPRKWGYKACKWLVEIEVTANAGYRGYWEQFGYHNDGDYPGPIFDMRRL